MGRYFSGTKSQGNNAGSAVVSALLGGVACQVLQIKGTSLDTYCSSVNPHHLQPVLKQPEP
jgi:hypothetical protein